MTWRSGMTWHHHLEHDKIELGERVARALSKENWGDRSRKHSMTVRHRTRAIVNRGPSRGVSQRAGPRGGRVHSKMRGHLLDKVIARDGSSCFYCLEPFTDDLEPTLDHVVPYSLGGHANPANLRAACEPCNTRRGNSSPAPERGAYATVAVRRAKMPPTVYRHPEWDALLIELGGRAVHYLMVRRSKTLVQAEIARATRR